MWLSNLLGFATTSIIVGVFYLIFFFLLIAIIGAGGAAMGDALTGDDPAALGEAVAGLGAGLLILVLIGTLFFIVLSIFIYSFLFAGSYSMVNEIALDGTSSFGTYFSSGFRFFGRMFFHLILMGLLLIPFSIPALVGEALVIWSHFNGSQTGVALWGIVAILGWIFVGIVNLGAMHGPVILTAENKGAWESLKLSYKVTVKSFGKAFVTIVSVIGAVIAYYVVFGLPMMLSAAFASEDNIGAALLYLLFLGLFLLTLPFAQMAFQLIVSLRYKWYLRKWVVPEEEWPDQSTGNTGENGFTHTAFPPRDDSLKTEPSPTAQPKSEGETDAQPSSNDPGETDARPRNQYPQFPTDPHLK